VELAAEVREKAGALPGVRVADRGARLCAIATVEVAGRDAEDLGHRLRQAGVNVNVSLMGEGPKNAPEAGATPVLRISPHYYNTSEEIDRAVAALGGLLEPDS
jgi:selenocysteine lyase/cysteine desulfurase